MVHVMANWDCMRGIDYDVGHNGGHGVGKVGVGKKVYNIGDVVRMAAEDEEPGRGTGMKLWWCELDGTIIYGAHKEALIAAADESRAIDLFIYSYTAEAERLLLINGQEVQTAHIVDGELRVGPMMVKGIDVDRKYVKATELEFPCEEGVLATGSDMG